MKVSIIVAVAENGVIGKNNALIWHLPNDLRYFKEKTLNHVIITGRKNYESIPEKYRPLPNRKNIVLTRNKNYKAPGATVLNSLQSAIEFACNASETECFIIGGGEIYKEALPFTDKIYLTRVHHSFDGDTFFPDLDDQWSLISSINNPADDKHAYPYTFCVYEKS